MLQRGNSGDGYDLTSTLCKYNLRKADLFVMSWARVRRVKRGSNSTELQMCGGGVRSILLFPLVCKYDLRKGDLFVIGWARVRRVIRGIISSESLMCGGVVRSILLLPLVA